MSYEFTMDKRVEFAETDMAGMVHFANFFRYMEMTEHSFFRQLGYSIHSRIDGVEYGWPRVHADCNYRNPVRFEETLRVHMFVRERRERSVDYVFIFRKVGDTSAAVIAKGNMTTVCAARDEATGQFRAVPIPPAIAELIKPAPAKFYTGIVDD